MLLCVILGLILGDNLSKKFRLSSVTLESRTPNNFVMIVTANSTSRIQDPLAVNYTTSS